MIHGQLFARKFSTAVVANSFAYLLAPPIRRPDFARFLALAADVPGVHSFHIFIGHERLITPSVKLVKTEKSEEKCCIKGSVSPVQMKQRLESAFPESDIQVVDLTGTEDHYEVFVRSPAFKGLTRIEQQRKVMDAFAPELKTGEVHALSIRTQS